MRLHHDLRRLLCVLTALTASTLLSLACAPESGRPPGAKTNTTTGTVIGTEGGFVISDDGVVTLTIPPHALTQTISFRIDKSTAKHPGTKLGVYDIMPSGVVFAEPATVTFSYTASTLGGRPAGGLRVVTYEANEAQFLDGWSLDRNAKQISGKTSHLSEFSVQAMDVPVSLPGVQWYSAIYEGPINLLAGCPAERHEDGQCGWNVESILNVSSQESYDKAMTGAESAQKAGLTNIIRIDYEGNLTVPTDPAKYSEWAENFYARVDAFVSSGYARRFIVGNEPPHEPEGAITPEQYIAAFNVIYSQKADRDIEILAAGPNAWIPGYWLEAVLAGITEVDGYAIHAYHEANRCANDPGQEDPDYPGTERCCDKTFIEETTDNEGSPVKIKVCRYDNWDWDGGFGYLRYQLRSIRKQWGTTKPVYITEFNSNWTPSLNYRSGIIEGAFRSVRTYLQECDIEPMPEVRSLVWFVDGLNPERLMDANSDKSWAGFSLAYGEPLMQIARGELAAEFSNPDNFVRPTPPFASCEGPGLQCNFCTDASQCPNLLWGSGACSSGQCVYSCQEEGLREAAFTCSQGLWRYPNGNPFGVCSCTKGDENENDVLPNIASSSDGIDNDCDGMIDEGTKCSIGYHPIYHPDEPGTSSTYCAMPCNSDSDCLPWLKCLDPGLPAYSRCSYVGEPCSLTANGTYRCLNEAVSCFPLYANNTVWECTPNHDTGG